ncbi:MAG: hypothetical protein K0S42_3365 [Microvirga sp.]|nr:hypothetical protein [Microvirga sp.]
MMLNSTSTGAVCFSASSQAPSSSGRIMAASRSHGRHYALDVSRGLRDSARLASASVGPSLTAARARPQEPIVSTRRSSGFD